MGDRMTRIIIILLLVVLGVYVGKPYVDRMLFSASTPRAIAPRGNLSELERTSIELFERVSPSVVQVVGRAGASSRCRLTDAAPRPVGQRLRLGRRRAYRHQRSRGPGRGRARHPLRIR